MSIRFLVLFAAVFSLISITTFAQTTSPTTLPSTIFNDPNYESAADPEIVWNTHTQEWWIFYTARRMTADVNAGCGGTPVGVAASKDFVNWTFVGYCKFDGVGGEKDGPTTLWAPGVIADSAGAYHMFITYCPTNGGFWGDGGETTEKRGKRIRHYICSNGDLLNGWTVAKPADIVSPPDSIDAGLFNENGTWTMVYRDYVKGADKAAGRKGTLFHATSNDGTNWNLLGPLPGDPADSRLIAATYQEAPYLFKWRGTYWLIADAGPKLTQYRSGDLSTWKFAGPLMDKSGHDPLDANSGKHPSVAVIGERAFIVYFNHPYKPADKSEREKKQAGRSLLHIRELQLRDGKLFVDRDQPVAAPENAVPATTNAGR